MTETGKRRPGRRRLALVAGGTLGLVAVVATAGAVFLLTRGLPEQAPPPREPLLPDLVMPRLDDFQIGIAPDTGKITLFFTATIANAGEGPLLLRADRRHRFSSEWRVDQSFHERDGGLSQVTTPANLVWGGHGHDHWHVRFGASYLLESLDTATTVVRNIRKAGYCFFDQIRSPRARDGDPRAQRFGKDTCSGLRTTSLEMGLSSGWEDPYYNFLPDQSLDVTNLPDGLYRLRATADPDRVLRESDESNNGTWVELRLTTSGDTPQLEVVRHGPSAGPRARI